MEEIKKNIVSVIIPIYKVEKYLSKCLDSVLSQTYKNLEIICVNDCSPDNSLKILEEYSQKDKRIVICNRKSNGGLSAARNSGLEIATGEYIYFLDSDDWMDEGYIEELVSKMKESNCDIVQNTNIMLSYDNENKNVEFEWFRNKEKYVGGAYLNTFDAINKSIVMVWCHLYKKSFIDRYNLKFPVGYIHEDEYFQHISKLNIDKIYAFYGNAKYYYVNRKDSIMTSSHYCIEFFLRTLKLVLDYYRENNRPILKYIQTPICSYVYEKLSEKDFFKIKLFYQYICENFNLSEVFKTDYQRYIAKSTLNSNTLDEYYKKIGKYPLQIYQTRNKLFRQKHIKMSLVIPFGNNEEYIFERLISLTNQTVEDIELLFINNSSSDKSVEIIKDFMKEDNRIRILSDIDSSDVEKLKTKISNLANSKNIVYVDISVPLNLNYCKEYLERILVDAE